MRVAALFLLLVYSAAFLSPWLPLASPSAQDRQHALEPPSRLHPLGTDNSGRDQLSRLIWGARVSLAAGTGATILALTLGSAAGIAAGYWGGWVDAICMRLTELLQSLPWIYLLIGVRSLLPLTLRPDHAFLIIAALLGIFGWARPARLIRSVVLTAREREYVEAARSFGASWTYLLRRHILPFIAGVVWTQAALLIPRFVLAEVTLSFFGLGVGEPVPSWGNMLSLLRDLTVLQSGWWMFAPAVLLTLAAASFHAIARELDDQPL